MLAAANAIGRSRVLLVAPQLARASGVVSTLSGFGIRPLLNINHNININSSAFNAVQQIARSFAASSDATTAAPTTAAAVEWGSLNSLKGDAAQSSASTGNFPALKHFKLEQFDKVLFIRMDMKDSKVNTLSQEFMQELVKALESIKSPMEAAVLISSKKDNFVAGADINMLAACKSASEAEALSRGGQQVLDAIANSPVPIIAAINGSCLGGGLELALAWCV